MRHPPNPQPTKANFQAAALIAQKTFDEFANPFFQDVPQPVAEKDFRGCDDGVIVALMEPLIVELKLAFTKRFGSQTKGNGG